METIQELDLTTSEADTVLDMQASVKNRTLADLKRGQTGILHHIDLDEYDSRRLMELGFVPGQSVTAANAAPGGDPVVFRVDGSEVALRRDTARHLFLTSK